MLGATHDQLPTPVNLARWNVAGSDKCRAVGCSAKGTLAHVLSNCGQSLSKYTWRLNQVLAVLEKAALELCEEACGGVSGVVPNCSIEFVNAGMKVYPKRTIAARSGLAPSTNWVVQSDLGRFVFPTDIVTTAQRPDMLVLSRSLKTILLVELTVPWEENMEWAHERKLLRYEQLAQDCKSKGWRCDVFAVEVGCRGFVGKLTVNLLKS